MLLFSFLLLISTAVAQELNTVSVYYGQTAFLDCPLNGTFGFETKWKRTNPVGVLDSDWKTHIITGKSTLELPDSSESDAGIYSCTTNDNRSSEVELKVLVNWTIIIAVSVGSVAALALVVMLVAFIYTRYRRYKRADHLHMERRRADIIRGNIC